MEKRGIMEQMFYNHTTLIIFLHIAAAVIWIGGMIAIRVAVHPTLQSIEDPKLKLGKTLEIIGRLFHLVIPFIALLLITGIIFELAGFKTPLVHIKEAIWTIMTLNYIFMYIKRAKAQKLFKSGKLAEAKEQMKLLPTLLLPINIFLGMVAIFLGVELGGK